MIYIFHIYINLLSYDLFKDLKITNDEDNTIYMIYVH